jgi:hypothetical protein
MSARPTTRVVARLLFVAALALAVLAPASAAFASASRGNYPPTAPTTDPCSRSYPAPPASCTSVQGTSTSDQATLPFTGGDVGLLSVIGVGVLGGGVLLVWMSRRRSRSAA